jgi:PhoH-like ATPase
LIKNYVLDTNVILHDPTALNRFQDNHVVIPIIVIEELDHFKKDLNMLGRNARTASKILDRMRETGRLAEGVPLENGGMLKVGFAGDRGGNLPAELRGSKQDNLILAVALELREKEPGVPVVVVTKDTNLRIKADALGLNAEDYETGRVDIEELYKGFREVDLPKERIDGFYEKGELPLEGDWADLYPNEFVLFREAGGQSSALGRHDAARRSVKVIPPFKDDLWGIRPKNKEQHFALEVLLDDSVKLVTLAGKAGTGKTLLAIAAGLRKTADDEVYQRLLVSRPVLPMGKDLGFLPGDVEEKLKPWMQPIFDNVEYLFGASRKRQRGAVGRGPAERRGGGDGGEGMRGFDGRRGYQELIDMGILEIEPLTYIRGRSIPNQYIIVDEAQNLTPHEVKTILTRAGENSKVVLTGDPYQIDNPFVDSASNGLSYVVERMKGEAMAGHVLLMKGERSPLAELAANLL